jgi:excisionase family DNA binding protein
MLPAAIGLQHGLRECGNKANKYLQQLPVENRKVKGGVSVIAKDFYTVKEIMQIMGISRALAYKLMDGEIPVIRMGRKILIPGWYIRKLSEEPTK